MTVINIPITLGLTLEEYWDFLQINECAARGIRNFPTTGVLGLGCGDYWNQDSRFYLASSINKVCNRLKTDRWLGFPIRREYQGLRQLDYSWPINIGKYVREVGIEGNTVIEAGKAITLRNGTINDPVEFTINVTFTDTDELVIYYPDSYPDDPTFIRPSFVSITSGVATVKIPRCRLLKSQYYVNYQEDTDRPDYETDANFVSTVDVYRNYTNTTTGTNLVWWRHYGDVGCCLDVFTTACNVEHCSDVRQLACPYIQNQRDGTITLEPTTYSGGYTKAAYAVSREPDAVEISYMKGKFDRYDKLPEELTRAIIAMAHNNLPRRYCSCDQQSLYYEDDTRPLEPPIRLKSGRSTWGLYEAEQILAEFDHDRVSYRGGLF